MKKSILKDLPWQGHNGLQLLQLSLWNNYFLIAYGINLCQFSANSDVQALKSVKATDQLEPAGKLSRGSVCEFQIHIGAIRTEARQQPSNEEQNKT